MDLPAMERLAEKRKLHYFPVRDDPLKYWASSDGTISTGSGFLYVQPAASRGSNRTSND